MFRSTPKMRTRAVLPTTTWFAFSTDRGFFKCKAAVTPGIRKGVIALAQGWEPKDFAEGHYQYLTHYVKNPVEEAISMTNAAFYDVRAEIEKA